MEGLSASLAASSATDDALKEIHAIADDISRKIEQLNYQDEHAIDDLAKLDAAFHLAISRAGGNDIVHEIISYIIPAFNESNKAFLYLRHKTCNLEVEHREIVAAIESRDPEAAEKAMRRHVVRVRKEILEIRYP
jgi:GntR family transcriptional repressor for pyruvate dehydrogenase complex